jgi:hypothetical protein
MPECIARVALLLGDGISQSAPGFCIIDAMASIRDGLKNDRVSARDAFDLAEQALKHLSGCEGSLHDSFCFRFRRRSPLAP